MLCFNVFMSTMTFQQKSKAKCPRKKLTYHLNPTSTLFMVLIFTFVPWAIKKRKGFTFPSTFFAKKSFQWQNITRSCLYYSILLLCHGHSKKVKALASLQCFLQKKSFQWQNITRSCLNYLFLLLCHEHSKKVKALASIKCFLQKKSFQWQNSIRSCLNYLLLLLCYEFSKKSKGLGKGTKAGQRGTYLSISYAKSLSKELFSTSNRDFLMK